MANLVYSFGSGVNDSVFGKSQEPIKAFVEQSIEAFENKSLISEMFAMETSTRFAEKYASETALGNFEPVGEGGNYPENGFQEGYAKVIESETWKNSFEVTKEAIEDAQFGKIKQAASGFALAYGRTRELFAAGLIAQAHTGTFQADAKSRPFSTNGADGVPFFSAAHPSITGGYGNQSNFYDGEFSYDNLCYLQEYMQNFRDDDGNLLATMPDTIMIPNDARLKKAVMNAIGAEGLPETNNHSYSFQYGLWKVIINPYLNNYVGSVRPWYLLDSQLNQAAYGAIWIDRVKLAMSSEIASNDNNIHKGRARWNAGFNNWRPYAMAFEGSGGTAFPT